MNTEIELLLKEPLTNLKDFQYYALATMPDLGSKANNIIHMNMGIATEIGELLDVYKKKFAYGKELDLVNISEEWADVMWYIACLHHIKGNKCEIESSYGTFSMHKTYMNYSIEDMLSIFSYKNYVRVCMTEWSENQFMHFWWYIGDRLEINKFQALTNNINKLHFRYKGKFDTYLALNRTLNTERKILENE